MSTLSVIITNRSSNLSSRRPSRLHEAGFEVFFRCGCFKGIRPRSPLRPSLRQCMKIPGEVRSCKIRQGRFSAVALNGIAMNVDNSFCSADPKKRSSPANLTAKPFEVLLWCLRSLSYCHLPKRSRGRRGRDRVRLSGPEPALYPALP